MNQPIDFEKRQPKPSRNAKRKAARLASVQAVYQMLSNDDTAKSIVREYRAHRFDKISGDKNQDLPDSTLFGDIVEGVSAHMPDLEAVITKALQNRDEKQPVSRVSKDHLLYSILLCGCYELLSHHDTDASIILNDYIDVGHAFFDSGETGLINAVLDRAKTVLREGQNV